jgi:hypothetical protein
MEIGEPQRVFRPEPVEDPVVETGSGCRSRFAYPGSLLEGRGLAALAAAYGVGPRG